MPKVFICYRRAQDRITASVFHEKAVGRWGDEHVFWDLHSIPPGSVFSDVIRDTIAQCDVMLVLIGKGWIGATDGDGQRQLDNSDDFVRMEIREALTRKIRVIPVLIDGAVMPGSKQLPRAISKLAGIQAFHFSSARDADRLLDAISNDTPPAPRPSSPPKSGTAPSSQAQVMTFQGVEFVRIPAGEFLMGSETGSDDEKPVHRVKISKEFWLGKYQVTQAQWEKVMGKNPSHFKGADLPVEQVSWEDCQKFIGRLNERESGDDYRLPTEAEWEYACRAGTTGDYAGDLDAMGWYEGNSDGKTHPVGQKQPNAWGLHDMHGNVWEWCEDWYAAYTPGAATDPTGPKTGSSRVVRGGSWLNVARGCRSAFRGIITSPGYRGYALGFRLLRTGQL